MGVRLPSVRCQNRREWSNFSSMRDLPLNAVRAYAAVFESGGVRAAARRLKITHSSVSRHLRELEAWVGVPLVDGTSAGRLDFTPQGAAIGRAALTSLAELTHAVAGARELRRSNSVTIATTASFARRWLLPRLPGLAESHPWVEVSVTVQQAVLPPTEQGADIALRMGEGPWSDTDAKPYMDERLFPVVSPAYWNRLGEKSAAAAMRKARLLHDRDPATSWDKWFVFLGRDGQSARSGPRFASTDLVLQAAELGLGVALARGRLAESALASGTLMAPFGAKALHIPNAYWLLRASNGVPRAAEAAVLEWLNASARADDLPMA